MKTIDLSKGQHTRSEVLALAKSEAVLIQSASGGNFIVEHADDFDREVAALGASAKLASLWGDRSKETGGIPIEEIRKKRGM